MGNPNTIMRPLYIKKKQQKEFHHKNLLGVIIHENSKWNCHVDYITAKASKKLYVLRLLKRAGVQEQDLVKVFRGRVRQIEQSPRKKRALKIIYTNSSYSQALSLANETTLSNRREHICHKFMVEMTDTSDHPLSCLVSTTVQVLIHLTLDLVLLDHSIRS